MIDRLAAWVDRINRPAVIWGLAIAFLVLSALFSVLYAQMDTDLALIDGYFGSTVAETNALMEGLGSQARSWYAIGEVTLDLAYPLVYSTLLALLLTRLLPAAFPGAELLHRLRLLPFGGGLFDLAENLSIVTLILVYPTQLNGLARLLSIFNQVKWVILGSCVALVLISALVAGLRRLGKRN